jgi:hypothetical protein
MPQLPRYLGDSDIACFCHLAEVTGGNSHDDQARRLESGNKQATFAAFKRQLCRDWIAGTTKSVKSVLKVPGLSNPFGHPVRLRRYRARAG